MNKKVYRQGLLIIIALAVPIIPFAIIGELPGEIWLSSTDENATLFALTGAGLLTLDVALPLPSSIIGTLIGARLGVVPGFMTILLGLTVGNLVGYFVGNIVLRKAGAELPEVPTLLVVFLSRPVPVLAEAMTITSGAARMPLHHFLIASVAGNSIYSLVLAANGSAWLPDDMVVAGLVIPMTLPVLAWLIWRIVAANR